MKTTSNGRQPQGEIIGYLRGNLECGSAQPSLFSFSVTHLSNVQCLFTDLHIFDNSGYTYDFAILHLKNEKYFSNIYFYFYSLVSELSGADYFQSFDFLPLF